MEINLNDSKQKKIAAIGIIIFGILILFLGFTQIKNKIYKPFDYLYKNDQKNNLLSLEQNASVEDLKNKDTDKDGLSDYNESYIYFTSPYLKDSDSDGILDKAEIESGTDPNCQPGKTCDKTGVSLSPKTDSADNEIEKKIENNNNVSQNISATTTPSIEEIKRILLENGISQEQLNGIDDETLRKTYEETVKTTGINPMKNNLSSQSEIPTNNSNEISNLGSQSVDLQNMSVEQMREFLIQSGIPEAELKQIDDEALKQLFQKAVKESINE